MPGVQGELLPAGAWGSAPPREPIFQTSKLPSFHSASCRREPAPNRLQSAESAVPILAVLSRGRFVASRLHGVLYVSSGPLWVPRSVEPVQASKPPNFQTSKKSACILRSGFGILYALDLTGEVAQLVEQRTENSRVVGSIPTLATSRQAAPAPIVYRLGHGLFMPVRGVRLSLGVPFGEVAQLVEQRTENSRVVGSIPTLATTSCLFCEAHRASFFCPDNLTAKTRAWARTASGSIGRSAASPLTAPAALRFAPCPFPGLPSVAPQGRSVLRSPFSVLRGASAPLVSSWETAA